MQKKSWEPTMKSSIWWMFSISSGLQELTLSNWWYTYHTTTRSSMETGCVSRDIPHHLKKTRQWRQGSGFWATERCWPVPPMLPIALLLSASNCSNWSILWIDDIGLSVKCNNRDMQWILSDGYQQNSLLNVG
jgi:hypothetical protein